jgi:hypothetical protein
MQSETDTSCAEAVATSIELMAEEWATSVDAKLLENIIAVMISNNIEIKRNIFVIFIPYSYSF